MSSRQSTLKVTVATSRTIPNVYVLKIKLKKIISSPFKHLYYWYMILNKLHIRSDSGEILNNLKSVISIYKPIIT